MNSEIYHPVNLIDCECSINSIDYNATDLIVELERSDNKGIVRIEFKEVFAYRVTLEHFRINDILEGAGMAPLYEVKNSDYYSWLMQSGMKVLYGDTLKVRHYAIKTTEYIIDIITPDSYMVM
ncbi:hypothetical protein [Bacteroides caecimuris]|uniref:hypothetical protein n=1 Tax=Bacteroides caecimuris TaxID=1796613 RepID=UPI002572A303|nr:hypothetical protein [Bacteroides caecimuris]